MKMNDGLKKKVFSGEGYWKMRIRLKLLDLWLNLGFSPSKKWRKRLAKEYYAHNGSMYFLADQHLAYVEISKVMSTSIKQALLGKEIVERVHRTFADSPRVTDEVPNPEDYFIFTFVRSPFRRLVSCYQDKVLSRKKTIFVKYLDGFLYNSKNFSDFLQRISIIPVNLQDIHFKNQYAIIYEESLNPIGRSKPDFIGHVEQSSQDWTVLQEKYPLPDLPRRNVSGQVKAKKKDWRDYYDEKTVQLVYELYRKDIEIFGYEDEYQELLAYCRQRNTFSES